MASVNKVIIIGNLGHNPEIRYMPNGEAVINISVATKEIWKDKKSGEKKELTEWHRIIFYRRLAEIVNEYLKKGSKIYIEGRLRTRKWTNKEGIEKYITEIIVDNLQMLSNKQYEKNNISSNDKLLKSNNKFDSTEKYETNESTTISKFPNLDDDIPF